MKLSELRNKKILILGFGREGQDTFLFLRRKFPGKVLGVADQLTLEKLAPSAKKLLSDAQNNTRIHLGKNYLKALKLYAVIVKSPGIPPRLIAPFITKKQSVTSQTEIFFEECQGTIIGVTGTKGKSTTAWLCYTVLKHAGKKVHLIGNIGEPVLQFLEKTRPNDIFVYELSSFQLTNFKKSPHIAVFLNLYPEHLDYYGGNLRSYGAAKANITKHQTTEDFLIYNSKDSEVCRIAKNSKAQKLPFSPVRSRTSDRWIASAEPARIIGKLFGIPKKKIQQVIRNFKPLPHRLERVGEFKGITFYNDSLATIPEATMRALDALGQKVHTLVLGGYDRGISFEKLGKKIEKSSVKVLILFPTTGKKILESMKRPPAHFFAKDMQEAVRLCYAHTPKRKICLLSPASSSFNMFKDYADRGNQFKKWVVSLSNHGKKA